ELVVSLLEADIAETSIAAEETPHEVVHSTSVEGDVVVPEGADQKDEGVLAGSPSDSVEKMHEEEVRKEILVGINTEQVEGVEVGDADDAQRIAEPPLEEAEADAKESSVDQSPQEDPSAADPALSISAVDERSVFVFSSVVDDEQAVSVREPELLEEHPVETTSLQEVEGGTTPQEVKGGRDDVVEAVGPAVEDAKSIARVGEHTEEDNAASGIAVLENGHCLEEEDDCRIKKGQSKIQKGQEDEGIHPRPTEANGPGEADSSAEPAYLLSVEEPSSPVKDGEQEDQHCCSQEVTDKLEQQESASDTVVESQLSAPKGQQPDKQSTSDKDSYTEECIASWTNIVSQVCAKARARQRAFSMRVSLFERKMLLQSSTSTSSQKSVQRGSASAVAAARSTISQSLSLTERRATLPAVGQKRGNSWVGADYLNRASEQTTSSCTNNQNTTTARGFVVDDRSSSTAPTAKKLTEVTLKDLSTQDTQIFESEQPTSQCTTHAPVSEDNCHDQTAAPSSGLENGPGACLEPASKEKEITESSTSSTAQISASRASSATKEAGPSPTPKQDTPPQVSSSSSSTPEEPLIPQPLEAPPPAPPPPPPPLTKKRVICAAISGAVRQLLAIPDPPLGSLEDKTVKPR
ncbi:unnamed protein product, partial [Amoebophrya sp. A25]